MMLSATSDEATQAFKAAVERGTAASSAIDAETGVAVEPGESTVVAVQVASGVCAGRDVGVHDHAVGHRQDAAAGAVGSTGGCVWGPWGQAHVLEHGG
jgi:hypothetical protein